MCIYISLMLVKNKNPLYIVNVVFELIGAICRILFFLDPVNGWRLLTSESTSLITNVMIPWTTSNCLLTALYLHESMQMKSLKINTFISNKTQWIFYLSIAILIAPLVVVIVFIATPLFAQTRLPVALIYIISTGLVGIYYAITAGFVLKYLVTGTAGGKNADVKRRKNIKEVCIRFGVNTLCLFLFSAMLTMALLAPTPQMWGTGIFMLYLGLSVVAVSNVISLSILNNRGTGVNTAQKTAKTASSSKKTKTKTSSSQTRHNTTNTDNGDEDLEDGDGDDEDLDDGNGDGDEELLVGDGDGDGDLDVDSSNEGSSNDPIDDDD